MPKGTGKKGTGKWSVWGYDTIEGGDAWYPIDADWTVTPRRIKEYDTEEEALTRAHERFKELDVSQPSKTSGGQSYYCIQDMVYIQMPNGCRYRVSPRG